MCVAYDTPNGAAERPSCCLAGLMCSAAGDTSARKVQHNDNQMTADTLPLAAAMVFANSLSWTT